MTQSVNELIAERGEPIELTTRERHELLSAPHRRLALGVLLEASGPMDLGELAERVATADDAIDADDEDAVHRVAAELHHVHLPKLDEASLVDYDREGRRIEPNPVLVE